MPVPKDDFGPGALHSCSWGALRDVSRDIADHLRHVLWVQGVIGVVLSEFVPGLRAGAENGFGPGALCSCVWGALLDFAGDVADFLNVRRALWIRGVVCWVLTQFLPKGVA